MIPFISFQIFPLFKDKILMSFYFPSSFFVDNGLAITLAAKLSSHEEF